MDLTAPAVASWAGMIQLLLRDLDEPSGLSTAGAAASPWSDFLMTGLLLAQPHNYSDRLARGQADTARPPSVQSWLGKRSSSHSFWPCSAACRA